MADERYPRAVFSSQSGRFRYEPYTKPNGGEAMRELSSEAPSSVRDHRNEGTSVMAQEARRVVLATMIGTTLEWYDFFIYALCAAMVFGPLYFPAGNPLVTQLAALGTFTVGFVARPLGGVIAGHFGDWIGRKRMLVVTLFIMGCSTVAVGLLPTYAQIGPAAPALLVTLRIIQGLAMGGEWGGAVSMAIEYAPADRRALYAAGPGVAPAVALVLSNMALMGLLALTGNAFAIWGWRLAFLSSVVLMGIGLYVRRRLQESPLFKRAVEHEPAVVPFVEVLRTHTSTVLKCLVIAGAPGVLSYMVYAFTLSYGPSHIGYDRSSLMLIAISGSVISIPVTVYCARLGDRFGFKRIIGIGNVLQICSALALFPLFDSGNLALAAVGSLMAITAPCVCFGCLPAMLTEQFPFKVRYTGISLAYQLGSVAGGGFAPIIATALLAKTGHSWTIGGYAAAANALALGCLMLARGVRNARS
ncbi:MFS transporter [Trinickia soli]|nr:MFS transporter [Trinickia soli]